MLCFILSVSDEASNLVQLDDGVKCVFFLIETVTIIEIFRDLDRDKIAKFILMTLLGLFLEYMIT